MRTKKLAIVVPIYNVASFLKECLESLVNQSYTNIELLLVNDGSTDNSFEIAKEYTSNDERIILFDKENGGLSSARNVGIEFLSKTYKFEFEKEKGDFYTFIIANENPLGIKRIYKSKNFTPNQIPELKIPKIDYLQFVDSDDFLERTCVQECIKRMNGVDILWFDEKYKLEVEIKPDFYKTSMFLYGRDQEQIIQPFELYRQNYNFLKWFWFSRTGVINFEFLQKIKLKFINGIIHEDNIFGILLFIQAKYIYVYPKKMYHYRLRSGSIMNFGQNTKSQKQKSKRAKSFLTMSLHLKNFIDSHQQYFFARLLKITLQQYLDEVLQNVDYEDFKSLNLQHLQNDIIKEYSESKDKKTHLLNLKNFYTYELGRKIVQAKSLRKILNLPFALARILKDYKQTLNLYLNEGQFPLQTLRQIHMHHLSFKFGQCILKTSRKWYLLSFFILPFSLLFIYKNHKNKTILNNDFNKWEFLYEVNKLYELMKLDVESKASEIKHFDFLLFTNKIEKKNYFIFYEMLLKPKPLICIDTDAKTGDFADLCLKFGGKMYAFNAKLGEFRYLEKKYENNNNCTLFHSLVCNENTEKILPKNDIFLQSSYFSKCERIENFYTVRSVDFYEFLRHCLEKYPSIYILKMNLDTCEKIELLKNIIEKRIFEKIDFILCDLLYCFEEFKENNLMFIKEKIKNDNIQNIIFQFVKV